MGNTIDLHIHSTFSDGADSPAQLLEKLKQNGITVFSVTDHDTMEGTLEMERIVPGDLRFIRGIEFSCVTPAGKCHILGYNFDPDHPVFRSALEEGRTLRREKLEIRLAYLREKLEIPVTDEEEQWLRSLKSPGKPHFGRIVMAHGLAERMDEAIQTYVNPCKIPRDRIEAETAVRAILAAGGIPIWAHPLGGEGEKRLTHDQFQDQLAVLLGYGIRGLECCYSRYTPKDRNFLLEQAAEHTLLVSGGSDYHGSNKPSLPLAKLCAEDSPIVPAQLTLLDQL